MSDGYKQWSEVVKKTRLKKAFFNILSESLRENREKSKWKKVRFGLLKNIFREREKKICLYALLYTFVFLTSRANFASFEDRNFLPFSKHADYSKVFLVL